VQALGFKSVGRAFSRRVLVGADATSELHLLIPSLAFMTQGHDRPHLIAA
jgi:hypothetical protein